MTSLEMGDRVLVVFTDGETHDSLPSVIARTLDAIKRRTRCGMGRCQGGFCTPRIIMHKWRASMTTPTPSGLRCLKIVSAICWVSRS